MTTSDARYTVIERDHYAVEVNTITDLDRQSANTLATVLKTGSAFQGDRPHTLEIVQQPSRADRLAAGVEQWLRKADSVSTIEQLAACVGYIAERLATVEDRKIPAVLLSVEMHAVSHSDSAEARVALIDELAALFGVEARLPESGHYGVRIGINAGIRLVTIVDKPEPKRDITTHCNWIGGCDEPLDPDRGGLLCALHPTIDEILAADAA